MNKDNSVNKGIVVLGLQVDDRNDQVLKENTGKLFIKGFEESFFNKLITK